MLRYFYTLAFTVLTLLSQGAAAHNRTVVIPLVGEDVEFVNPVVVPPAAFGPAAGTPVYIYGNGLWAGDNNGDACVAAPVYLPNGVTITQTVSRVLDNSDDNNITVTLVTSDLVAGGTATEILGSTIDRVSIPLAQDVIQSEFFVTGTVDTTQKTYTIVACLKDENIGILGVRVFFETP
ncbi:MAG: hypothetical protein AAF353_00015 [Pseudomonadota bacterium]